jgi:chromosome segregation protein
MLKALELIGFKSFADKTRFEFPAGITVVVGPNGSGKSNIVDAIKWVLGAQSAKALRGKDMADVIFKGSSEGGRKMLNTAEATIIFDNSESKLPVDAEEVHVTRRVYRSGEGEYLVNGQPCRLKDIRDLFRGTGVGVDAYSLIEQGKVDRMLQASSRDRRAIFEEAAGISRFKAKKVEAHRRLERVEQNLLRLSDIVEEVQSRLRSVRSQASKARRYREYSGRLQELRTQVGLTDWWRLSRQVQQIESELGNLRNEAAEVAAELESREARLLELDVEITNAVETSRLNENQLARRREQIAVRESSLEQAYSSIRDLEDIAARHRRQLAAMTGRAGDVQSRLRETTAGLRDAKAAFDQIHKQAADHERALSEVASQLSRFRNDRESRRTVYVENMRTAATLGNQISSVESQLQSNQDAEERTRQRLDEADRTVTACVDELEQQETAEQNLARDVETKRLALDGARSNLEEVRRALTVRQDERNEIQHRQSTTRERASVLDELERNREGLASGVRDVLKQASDATDGALTDIQGLVADLLQVSVDIAPLIDIALGDRAQHLVLSSDALLDEIQAGRYAPPARVGFIRAAHQTTGRPSVELGARPGVIGRADRLVACSPHFESAKESLLADTWFVDSLSVALALQSTVGAGCRFVTSSGGLVEPDGAVLVGPKMSTIGLVSRRAELRELNEQLEELGRQLEDITGAVAALTDDAAAREQAVGELEGEHDELVASLSEQQAQTRALRERRDHVTRQQQTLDEELNTLQSQHGVLAQELESLQADVAELDASICSSESELRDVEQRIEELDSKREIHAREATLAKVELAKSEQRLESLQARMTQFEEDRRERERAINESRTQLTQSSERLLRTQRVVLDASSELAALYLQKEQTAGQIANGACQHGWLTNEKRELASATQKGRQRAQRIDEQQHKKELSAGEVVHQRRSLAERILEDYGIELEKAGEEPSLEEQQEREEVEREIDELRRKINNIGAVNMEALNELDDLEARSTSLSGQYDDLVQAKESLERIIHRINADSRRLFEETLEAIRINFQTLYRKAFGGGRADLVLEEGVDVLEAGVEIIATPPGKPSFNNSLLSGGEKALTAVALLLAIFQYRPSPFCVLDEVDAPFDEANIGRFVDVLHGFLGWTKFVIVTHSKKTMTAATTLYGVTMQESGVSKRVSVRFEDVSEDGHISHEAVERSGSKGGDDERGAA